MHKVGSVLLVVVGGLVGGWGGYWIGHLAGWSVNATWPEHIGGGTGAILLSIGLAVAGVVLVDLAVTWAARHRK